jgi:hypothetical protein
VNISPYWFKYKGFLSQGGRPALDGLKDVLPQDARYEILCDERLKKQQRHRNSMALWRKRTGIARKTNPHGIANPFLRVKSVPIVGRDPASGGQSLLCV